VDIDTGAFVHRAAVIHGGVKIGYGSSVWPGAVFRGDFNSIEVGRYTSIQDNAVIHTSPFQQVRIGDWVTVGHGAVIHGATVGDRVLVGMRSVILDGAEIGDGSLIAAGVVVPEGKKIPPGSFVKGFPVEVRPAREGTAEGNRLGALTYYLLSRRYMEGVEIFPMVELTAEIKKWMEEHGGG